MGFASERLEHALQHRDEETAVSLGIDRHIVPLVFSLNDHGIRTEASCGGHTNRQHGYPWIGLDVFQNSFDEKSDRLVAYIASYDNRPPLRWDFRGQPFRMLRVIDTRIDYDDSAVSNDIQAALRASNPSYALVLQEEWHRKRRPDAATLKLMQQEVERFAYDLNKIYRIQGPWFTQAI